MISDGWGPVKPLATSIAQFFFAKPCCYRGGEVEGCYFVGYASRKRISSMADPGRII